MGFPNRPSRSDFGPTFEDTAPIRDPAKVVSAAQFNLSAHQTAGLSAVSRRAFLIADSAGVVSANAESWNPEGLAVAPFDPPVVAKTGTGTYTVDYNSIYPDENGVDVPVVPLFAVALPVEATGVVRKASAFLDGSPPAGKFRFNVETYEFGGGSYTATDLGFLFELV